MTEAREPAEGIHDPSVLVPFLPALSPHCAFGYILCVQVQDPSMHQDPVGLD